MRSFVLLIFLFCLFPLRSQPPGFVWPLDKPLVITGNYGELRPNHFHAGIDFSTRNQINLPVYAVADGYISRIRVSAGGYGKCIYITHQNGMVSVYAHLNSFSLKSAELVKKEQYKLRKFEVELLPSPGSIKVKAGEIIGLSGNTGGSTGPHLHFELRDEKSETPLNAMEFYQLPDVIPPALTAVALYDLTDTCNVKVTRTYAVKQLGSGFIIPQAKIEVSAGIVGLALSGFDRMAPRGNPNNIYEAALTLDGTQIYSHRLRGIDFADNRFVNEFSEVVARKKFQRCFLPSLYPAGIYLQHANKGRIVLNDTNWHKVSLKVKDERGNVSELEFLLRTRRPATAYAAPQKGDVFIDCRKEQAHKIKGFSVLIPAGSFYNSFGLSITNNLAAKGSFELKPAANLKGAILLGFPLPEKFRATASKVMLRSGSNVYLAAVKNDSAYFALKSLGEFKLLSDTIAPLGKPLIVKRKKNQKPRPLISVSFLISDALSGIGSYNLFLNDKWVLAEYDAKNQRLTYFFDDETPRGKLVFRLELSDRVGNARTVTHQVNRP